MANKLFLVSVTLSFFFLLTNASIYRTVVEFDENDATNPQPMNKCQKEFYKETDLRNCQRWIHSQMRKKGGGSPSMDDGLGFEDDIENPQGGPQKQHPILQQCCQELSQEDTDCVCPALKVAAEAIRYKDKQTKGPQLVKRIFLTAKNMPIVCNIPQLDVCPFEPEFYGPSYY